MADKKKPASKRKVNKMNINEIKTKLAVKGVKESLYGKHLVTRYSELINKK